MVYQGDQQAYRELLKQVSLLLFSPIKENSLLLYWRKDLLYLELQANAWNFEKSWYFREKNNSKFALHINRNIKQSDPLYFKVNELWYKQCGVNPHFCTGKNLFKKCWEKINIETNDWGKLFDRSADKKYCNIPSFVNINLDLVNLTVLQVAIS